MRNFLCFLLLCAVAAGSFTACNAGRRRGVQKSEAEASSTPVPYQTGSHLPRKTWSEEDAEAERQGQSARRQEDSGEASPTPVPRQTGSHLPRKTWSEEDQAEGEDRGEPKKKKKKPDEEYQPRGGFR